MARWLGRLQYDSEIRRHPGRLHNNADALSRRPRRQHGNCPSCTPTGLSQVTVVSRDLPVGETPREVRNCWYPLCTWYVLCRTLVFTSFYSKQRFYLCLAKWRRFRILFLRTTFTSVFVTKLHFWCSILLEKCFGLLATKIDYLWAVYHKNQRFCLSVFKIRCV